MSDKIKRIHLDKDIILSLGFKLISKEDSPFKDFDMPYYVKDKVVLFFNDGYHNDGIYLISFAEQRNSKYNAVAIRWIRYVDELVRVYDVMTNMSLNADNI